MYTCLASSWTKTFVLVCWDVVGSRRLAAAVFLYEQHISIIISIMAGRVLLYKNKTTLCISISDEVLLQAVVCNARVRDLTWALFATTTAVLSNYLFILLNVQLWQMPSKSSCHRYSYTYIRTIFLGSMSALEDSYCIYCRSQFYLFSAFLFSKTMALFCRGRVYILFIDHVFRDKISKRKRRTFLSKKTILVLDLIGCYLLRMFVSLQVIILNFDGIVLWCSVIWRYEKME